MVPWYFLFPQQQQKNICGKSPLYVTNVGFFYHCEILTIEAVFDDKIERMHIKQTKLGKEEVNHISLLLFLGLCH